MGSNCLQGVGFLLGRQKYFGIRWRWWLQNIVNVLNFKIIHFKMVNSMLCEFHLDEKYTQNKLILQIPFCDKMTHVFNSQELNKQLT